MSQTHGDVSGARPTQDYSACEHSLTHITLGAGPSIQHYSHPQPSAPAAQHYQQQLNQSQRRSEDTSIHQAGQTAGLDQLPGSGSAIFSGRSTLNGGTTIYGASQQQQQQRFGGPGGAAAESQDFLLPPQVYDNSMMLKEQGDPEDNPVDDPEDREGGDADDGADGNSQGSGKRSRTRRPHLQGRFSGRLTTKEDERRLAEECKLLGPLLGGVGKRGDKSRLTLAKIVRGIATGDVRRFCEERERAIGMLKSKLAAIDPDAAASVPVNPIPLPSSGLGGPLGGSLSALGGGSASLGGNPSGLSMGIGLGLGGLGHGRQVENLQRENADLQHEVHTLRMELQARERLLLELQDTGIISGFVPTSIPLDEPNRLMSHQAGPMSGIAGGARSQSTDMQPAGYGLPPRHQSYTHPPVGSYGAPSQMALPQSSAHVSSGMEPGPMGGALGLSHSLPPPAQHPGGGALQQPGGSGALAGDSASMGAMPAMSEHSRAGRPLKRQAIPDLAGGGGGGSAYGEVPRSLSHPPLGRGGAGGGFQQQVDLQQQLNSLQAQVEHLQNLSQTQGSGRSAGSYLMPARERSGLQMRMGSAGVAAGGGTAGGGSSNSAPLQFGSGSAAGGPGAGGSIGHSPFLSSHSGPQGGLLMLPGHHQGDSGGHTYHTHPGIGAPLQLQVVKPSSMYNDLGGGGRDPREAAAGRHGIGDGDGGYGGGGAAHLDATLEHMINSRAMRGEYDLPLELLMPDGAGKGGGGVPGTH